MTVFSQISTAGRLRRSIGVAVGVLTLTATSVFGVASAASASIAPMGTCGQTFNPSVSGGKAHWDLICSGGNITMSGWVEDTSADGKCAYVTATFNNNINEQAKACPSGTRTPFSWTHPGTIVDGYLTVV